MEEIDEIYDGDRLESYVEEEVSPTSTPDDGFLTSRISGMLGVEHPLTIIARKFESNSIQRDDVLIAMAARDGINVSPTNFGNVRGYYSFLDGQSVLREYAERIVELAYQCSTQGVPSEEVRSWINASPSDVQSLLRTIGMDIPDDEVDEENEYYADRLALFMRYRVLRITPQ